jgi:hypothetical protein
VTTLGFLLVAAGLALIAVAAWLARAPLTMIRHLDATEANLRRYEEWRGGHHAYSEGGTTGADEMRAFMRRRLLILAAVGIAGGVLVVVGLLQR